MCCTKSVFSVKSVWKYASSFAVLIPRQPVTESQTTKKKGKQRMDSPASPPQTRKPKVVGLFRLDAPERQPLPHCQLARGTNRARPGTRAGFYHRWSVHPRARSGHEPHKSVVRGSTSPPQVPQTFVFFAGPVQTVRSSGPVWRSSFSDVSVRFPGPISSAGFSQSPGFTGVTGVIQLLGSASATSSMRLISLASGFPSTSSVSCRVPGWTSAL